MTKLGLVLERLYYTVRSRVHTVRYVARTPHAKDPSVAARPALYQHLPTVSEGDDPPSEYLHKVLDDGSISQCKN